MKKLLIALALLSFASINLITADETITCNSDKDCKKGEECKSVCVPKEEKKMEISFDDADVEADEESE